MRYVYSKSIALSPSQGTTPLGGSFCLTEGGGHTRGETTVSVYLRIFVKQNVGNFHLVFWVVHRDFCVADSQDVVLHFTFKKYERKSR